MFLENKRKNRVKRKIDLIASVPKQESIKVEDESPKSEIKNSSPAKNSKANYFKKNIKKSNKKKIIKIPLNGDPKNLIYTETNKLIKLGQKDDKINKNNEFIKNEIDSQATISDDYDEKDLTFSSRKMLRSKKLNQNKVKQYYEMYSNSESVNKPLKSLKKRRVKHLLIDEESKVGIQL